MAKPKNKRPASSELRIIGGQWRSRKLAFTPAPGLRPTSDRVRETLFNWLAPVIHDARCADLFAGSGALGLEALSRGAASCDFVDKSQHAQKQISGHLTTLDAHSRGRCHCLCADSFINNCQATLDIVFIDPPFGQGLVEPACRQLEQSGLLANVAWLYIETAKGDAAPDVPLHWELYRDKHAGEVAYRLYRRQTSGASEP